MVVISSAFVPGTAIFGINVLVTPMETELGWRRSTLFVGLSLGLLAAALVVPIMGLWLDRPPGGARLVLVARSKVATDRGSYPGHRYSQTHCPELETQTAFRPPHMPK